MDLTIYRAIAVVEVRQTQNQSRTYWNITDATGKEWKCWDPNPAVACNNVAGTGQLMQLGVRIAPARDPQYGMNYTIRAAALAPQGAQPTPPGAEDSQQMPMPAMGQMQGPQMPTTTMMPPQPMAAPVPGMPPQAMPQPQGALPAGPIKTMGQGGNFSDADIVRMSRSTAAEAATHLAVAFAPDFSDPEGNFDWMRFWLAAEAISKFITHRAHEGWVPGVEMEAPMHDGTSNEQQVLAEVQALPGTVEVPVPPQGVPPQASAENAGGGEIDWDNP